MAGPHLLDFTNTQAVEALFDEAFQHPRQQYVVQPVNREIAEIWLKEYTTKVNFVWCGGVKSFEKRLQEAGPLHYGQLIHLDILYGRDRCGWAARGYHCEHPDADPCPERGCDCEEEDAAGPIHRKGMCYAYACPLASEADREDIRNLDPDLYRMDYEECPDAEPDGWMVLHSRPRHAYVPNVTVLGCEHLIRW